MNNQETKYMVTQVGIGLPLIEVEDDDLTIIYELSPAQAEGSSQDQQGIIGRSKIDQDHTEKSVEKIMDVKLTECRA